MLSADDNIVKTSVKPRDGNLGTSMTRKWGEILGQAGLTQSHKPTNKSPAPHAPTSARTQRTTQDKQWDCGRCRSRRPVPALVSRDREGTCGHAIEDHAFLSLLYNCTCYIIAHRGNSDRHLGDFG